MQIRNSFNNFVGIAFIIGLKTTFISNFIVIHIFLKLKICLKTFYDKRLKFKTGVFYKLYQFEKMFVGIFFIAGLKIQNIFQSWPNCLKTYKNTFLVCKTIIFTVVSKMYFLFRFSIYIKRTECKKKMIQLRNTLSTFVRNLFNTGIKAQNVLQF